VINSISSAFLMVPCEGFFGESSKRPGFSEFLAKRPMKNSRKQAPFAMRPRCQDRPAATWECAANWSLPNVTYPQANVRAYWPEDFRIGMDLSPFAFSACREHCRTDSGELCRTVASSIPYSSGLSPQISSGTNPVAEPEQTLIKQTQIHVTIR
jgi:hypothetical protein